MMTVLAAEDARILAEAERREVFAKDGHLSITSWVEHRFQSSCRRWPSRSVRRERWRPCPLCGRPCTKGRCRPPRWASSWRHRRPAPKSSRSQRRPWWTPASFYGSTAPESASPGDRGLHPEGAPPGTSGTPRRGASDAPVTPEPAAALRANWVLTNRPARSGRECDPPGCPRFGTPVGGTEWHGPAPAASGRQDVG